MPRSGSSRSSAEGRGPAREAGRPPSPGSRRARLASAAALAAVVVLLLWRIGQALLGGRLDVIAASPETQVREALVREPRVVLPGAGGPGARAELTGVRFGDVAVQADGDRAQVLAVVEGRGTVSLGGERIELGYVGREAFAMARCGVGRWCPEGEALPALSGVLAALRAQAEAAGIHVRAWQIRVERDRATAGEDYEVDGPRGRERRRALHALRRERGRWGLVEGT